MEIVLEAGLHKTFVYLFVYSLNRSVFVGTVCVFVYVNSHTMNRITIFKMQVIFE